ncbi:MAG: type II toxin-antitoxin system PemK/MazF family toxin [Verrucomicrobia bacterium]|nr:type II toxin-antitoxin system PemK/MazF family toxin [Verrucomicrobiota bacterium]
MTPKIGDVFMIDLGYEGKVRPVVVVSREDPDAPRALSIAVPLTAQFRGSRYEVKMPRVPWLNLQSYANVQAISSVEHHELTNRRGRFESSIVEQIRESIRWALEL